MYLQEVRIYTLCSSRVGYSSLPFTGSCSCASIPQRFTPLWRTRAQVVQHLVCLFLPFQLTVQIRLSLQDIDIVGDSKGGCPSVMRHPGSKQFDYAACLLLVGDEQGHFSLGSSQRVR